MRLGPDLSIRVWGGDLAPCYAFSFDFVDGRGDYIAPPADIRIHAEGFPGEVLSIEESMRRVMQGSSEFKRTFEMSMSSKTKDLKWETYVIPEGTRLRIIRRGQQDRFLTIPRRDQDQELPLVVQQA